MSDKIKVIGGNKLEGVVTPIPNKNSLVAVLPLSIISNKPIIYYNVPNTSDVLNHFILLKSLGAKVDDSNLSKVVIDCSNISQYELNQEQAGKMRASIMYVGPLLARFGKAVVPVPGGCLLGQRSIAAHVDVFKKAGACVEFDSSTDTVAFTIDNTLKSDVEIWQSEASVTATENILMYFAGITRTLKLIDAACEPHVIQVEKLLASMGAVLSGIGSNIVTISGTTQHLSAEFYPEPDFVDIAGYIVASAITKGNIRIKGANLPHIIGGIVNTFKKFNININFDGADILVKGDNELYIDPITSGFALASEDLPKLPVRPWPGFPVDILPVMATLASKTKGKLLLQNWMYENGLDFVRELNKMGANIFVCDPQRVIVHGPVVFKDSKVVSPGIIQACKALFLASLCDTAETEITGIDILKRRYPDIINTYKALGADIAVLD